MLDISVDGIKLPTQQAIDDASVAFDDEWGEVDKVLYAVCREHPKHDERRHVTAKVALVGRAYQAGLERCITPGPGQQAVMVGADYIWKRGAAVDDIIAAVQKVSEPLTSDDAQELVEQHGRFTQLLGEMPDCNRLPRSFASKYCTSTTRWCRSTTATQPSRSANRLGGASTAWRSRSLLTATLSTGTTACGCSASTTRVGTTGAM